MMGFGPMINSSRLVLIAKAGRAFADGLVGLVLPTFLLGLDYSPAAIGAFVTVTLLGSAAATLSVGPLSRHFDHKVLLLAACLVMAATGLGLGLASHFWLIMLIGLIGTTNPSGGDVTPFLPLDHAILAEAEDAGHRTHLFALYSTIGAIAGALGAAGASLHATMADYLAISPDLAARMVFGFYSLMGIAVWCLYRMLPKSTAQRGEKIGQLHTSRRKVYLLAGLFSLDSFGGGFLVQTLIVVWLHQQFQLTVQSTGLIFFLTGLLGGASQFGAVWLSRRIGLVNTMVYTHIPAGLCVIAMPFAPNLETALCLLFIRAGLQQMDVPVRSSLVMAMVMPDERAAAASLTSVPRSLASSVAPILAGSLLSASPIAWPFVMGGLIKISYDLGILMLVREPSAASREK
jgi:predicted MFS family arabinose efflux permease